MFAASQAVAFLQEGRYEELERLFVSMQDDVTKDIHNEDNLVRAFQAFHIPDSEAAPLFNIWVQRMPGSWAALAARADYYVNLAWEYRGYGWAKDVKPEGFDGMDYYLALADRDARASLKIEPKQIGSYRVLIRAANSSSAKGRSIVDAALKYSPSSVWIRTTYLNFLKPRWDGSYEEMDRFIDESLSIPGASPELKFLRGYGDFDRCDALLLDKHPQEAVEACAHALAQGEYWDYYLSRAEAYDALEQYEAALSDLNLAVRLNPGAANAYAQRGLELFRLRRIDEALVDIQTARALEPFNEKAQNRGEVIAGNLLLESYNLVKDGDAAGAAAKSDLAVRFAPCYADAYFRRGYDALLLKSWDSSAADFQKAISLDPRNFEYYKDLDFVLSRQQDADGIIKAWTQFIALEPSNAQAYLERGGAYVHKHDMESAQADAKKACELGSQEGCQHVSLQSSKR